MEIGIPNINDYEQIDKLAVQVHKLHAMWRPDLFIEVDSMFTKEQIAEAINNKEIFVAKENNQVVGYIMFRIKEQEAKGFRYRKQLNIDVICVDETKRGLGIGTSIMNYTKEYAKSQSCTDMYLTVNEENTEAIKLYEKLGFKLKNIAYSMQI